jgi:hypothetical protein
MPNIDFVKKNEILSAKISNYTNLTSIIQNQVHLEDSELQRH